MKKTDKNNSKERGVLKNGNRRHHYDGSVSLSSDKTKNNPYVREKKNWEID